MLCNVLTDIDDLLNYFVAGEIITIDENEAIKSCKTKPEKVQKFLENISNPLNVGITIGYDFMMKVMKERGTLPTKLLAEKMESCVDSKHRTTKMLQGTQLIGLFKCVRQVCIQVCNCHCLDYSGCEL